VTPAAGAAELSLVARALDRAADVVSVAGRPSSYATSHPLTELEVAFRGGDRLELVVKELGARALTQDALRAKACFLYDPQRELEVYRDVLAGAELGTATLHVLVEDEGRRLLAIERVRGRPLTEVGELATWCAVAAWLAVAHRRLAAARTPRLVQWTAELVGRWWERATLVEPDPVVASVAERSSDLAARLLLAPIGLLHGELFASNVIVGDGGRVCPVDWELAGVGPQLFDLAALVAGRWPDADRRAIALAYRSEMDDPPAEDAFLEQLDLCRLQVAGQLLAANASWTPPTEHAHDWLSDVHALAPRLQLA